MLRVRISRYIQPVSCVTTPVTLQSTDKVGFHGVNYVTESAVFPEQESRVYDKDIKENYVRKIGIRKYVGRSGEGCAHRGSQEI